MDERQSLEPMHHQSCRAPAPAAARDPVSSACPGGGPSVGCVTHEPRHLEGVRSWLAKNLPEARSIAVGYAVAHLPRELSDSILARCDVLVLDRPTPDACAALGPLLDGANAPELVVVGASREAVTILRKRSSSLPLELGYPWSAARVGAALQQAWLVRLPLRRLGQEAVGRIPIVEALSVLRFHMLRGAVGRSRSSRSVAALLGVTRTQVRSMLRQIRDAQPCGRGE